MLQFLVYVGIGLFVLRLIMKQIGALFGQTEAATRQHIGIYLRLLQIRMIGVLVLGLMFLAVIVKLDVKMPSLNAANTFSLMPSFELPSFEKAEVSSSAREDDKEEEFDEEEFLNSFVDW